MVDELPPIIPIFPLPNLVLFPGVKVPLHIFEPRYREMVEEVCSSHGIIGMILLKGDWERDYCDYPDIFEIGCAGRIGNLARLPDGRFNLVLDGLLEFRVIKELRDRPFRRANGSRWRRGRRRRCRRRRREPSSSRRHGVPGAKPATSTPCGARRVSAGPAG